MFKKARMYPPGVNPENENHEDSGTAGYGMLWEDPVLLNAAYPLKRGAPEETS